MLPGERFGEQRRRAAVELGEIRRRHLEAGCKGLHDGIVGGEAPLDRAGPDRFAVGLLQLLPLGLGEQAGVGERLRQPEVRRR